MFVPRRIVALVASATILLLAAAPIVSAHPLSTTAVLLDVGEDAVSATIELPLDQLSVALDDELTMLTVLDPVTLASLRAYVEAHMAATDASGRRWTTVVTGGRVEDVDGVDSLIFDATLRPNAGPVGDFELHYDAILATLISHRVFVSGRYGHSGDYTTLAMLSWQRTSVPVASASPPATQGLLSAVGLGIEHIRTGSDHLLFLLMLLLPAPLHVAGRRWSGRRDGWRAMRQVLHVATAFAIGHSITLALGALGWIALPTTLVESGIAISVLVSAIHAIRPLVRGGEVFIAGGFGLLHGLAFAGILRPLALSQTSLVETLLGFNIGIEVAQLAVVALVMPSLILLSRRHRYSSLRLGAASLGALLAFGWLVERVGLLPTNPLEPVAAILVDQPLTLVAGLAIAAGSSVVWGRGWQGAQGERPIAT